MTVEVVDSVPRFSTLRAAWNDLCARAIRRTPTLTFEWLSAWWDAFGNDDELAIVIVRERERILAAVPLMRTMLSLGGIRWRVAASLTNNHSQIAGVLLSERPKECIDAILDHLRASWAPWHMLRLADFCEGNASFQSFTGRLSARKWPYLVQPKRTAAVLTIDGEWDDYVAALGKRFRESMRRKARKASRSGATATVHSSAEDTDVLIDRAFDVASRSWKHERGSAIMSTEPLRRFYRNLARNSGRAGWLRMAFLSQERVDVGFELNLDYAGERYDLKMGFDEKYRWLSPGVVLRQHVLKNAFDEGLRKFHFLGDQEPHKDHWASEWEQYSLLTVFGRGILPKALYLTNGVLRERARRLRWLRALKQRLTLGVKARDR